MAALAASAFSFLQGASRPEQLIEQAVALDKLAMAFLDYNDVYGSARFHTSAAERHIRTHVGVEISVSSLGSRLTPPGWLPHQRQYASGLVCFIGGNEGPLALMIHEDVQRPYGPRNH
jgi:DNA polymerase III alpha subunit